MGILKKLKSGAGIDTSTPREQPDVSAAVPRGLRPKQVKASPAAVATPEPIPGPQPGDLMSGGHKPVNQPIDLRSKQPTEDISGSRAFVVNAANAGTAGFLPDIANLAAKGQVGGVSARPTAEAVKEYMENPNVPQADKDELQRIIDVSIGFSYDPAAGHNMREEIALSNRKKPLYSMAGNMAGTTALGMAVSPAAGENVLGQVGLDVGQAALQGYNTTEKGSPQNAAIAGLTQMGMSSGMAAGRMIGNKAVPVLENFYSGTPQGTAAIPFRKGIRVGLPESSKEAGPVGAEFQRLGGAPAFKTREGFIKDTLEPAMRQTADELAVVQRSGDWMAQAQNLPEPSRLRLADRLEKIAEDMMLSGDPQYTSTGQELVFYVRNVLDAAHSVGRFNIGRDDLRGIVSSIDEGKFQVDPTTGKTSIKYGENAMNIIRQEAKQAYHDSIDPSLAKLEGQTRDRFSSQSKLLENMSRAEDKGSGFLAPAQRQLQRAAEGLSGTLAVMAKKFNQHSGMSGGVRPMAGSRLGSILSQMMQQDPKDQATDHYVMYHNDPEYRKLYDETVGMSTNE